MSIQVSPLLKLVCVLVPVAVVALLRGGTATPAVTVLIAAGQHAADNAVERFSAVAVNMAATGSGPVTSPVSIVITRWSSDADRQALATALREKGPSALLDTLKDMPRVGSIARTGSVGEELNFAHRVSRPDKSERIVLLAARRMSIWELRSGSVTTDYPFTLIELRVGPDGTGEGKASLAAKITTDSDSNSLELENYANQPVALQDVMRNQ